LKRRPAVAHGRPSASEGPSSKAGRGAASIRRLAATVAHEINNPLTSILLAAEKLAGDPSLEQEVLHEVQTIREAAFRIRGIVEKLQKVRADRAKEYLPGIQMLDVNGES